MPDLQPGLEQGDTWWVWEYTSAHKGSIASVSVAEEPQEMSGAGSNSSLLWLEQLSWGLGPAVAYSFASGLVQLGQTV